MTEDIKYLKLCSYILNCSLFEYGLGVGVQGKVTTTFLIW